MIIASTVEISSIYTDNITHCEIIIFPKAVLKKYTFSQFSSKSLADSKYE